MPDGADLGRLRPRTLVRGRRWTARLAAPAPLHRLRHNAFRGRLGRWRPRLAASATVLAGVPSVARTLARRAGSRIGRYTRERLHAERHTRSLVSLANRVSLVSPAGMAGAERRGGGLRLVTVSRREVVHSVARPFANPPEATPVARLRTAVAGPAGITERPLRLGGVPPVRTAPTQPGGRSAGPVRRPLADPVHTRADRVMAVPAAKRAPAAVAAIPAQVPAHPAPAPRQPPGPPVDLDELVDRVLRRIERRAVAQRERLGRF